MRIPALKLLPQTFNSESFRCTNTHRPPARQSSIALLRSLALIIERGDGARKRIDISLIENAERLQVTFSKRKSGLFKKASELSLLCGAPAAVVVFSPAGKAFAVGSPSVDHVLRLFAPLPGDGGGDLPDALLEGDVDPVADREAVEATVRRVEEARARVAAEEARMDAVGDRVLQAAAAGGGRFWWEADVEALGEDELPEFARALQRLRDNVRRHADNLPASAQPPPPQ